jgi:predicted MFS family arabinose efflux permease
MAVLVVPGALAMIMLLRIWRSMGNRDLSGEETGPTETTAPSERRESLLSRLHGGLPSVFWLFAAASAAISGGLVTFAVISYHLTQDHFVSLAAVPVIYAAAMGAEALAALGSGWLFDRTRGGALLGLPFLVAAVPVLAFATSH